MFGWLSDSFVGVESDVRHTLQVGFEKGMTESQLMLMFNIYAFFSAEGKLLVYVIMSFPLMQSIIHV